VKLLTQYDWKEVCAPSQSQVNVGTSARLSSQDGVSHQEETATFSLPQFNRLFEASFVREESSASNADVAVIPSQHRVTQQILSHWQLFRDLVLESQEEDDPKRILFFKPMSWLGQIRTHRRDEPWCAGNFR
jgi:hypothetical protein